MPFPQKILLMIYGIALLFANLTGFTTAVMNMFLNYSISELNITHTYIDESKCLCRIRCEALPSCNIATVYEQNNGSVLCELSNDLLPEWDLRQDDTAITLYKQKKDGCNTDDFRVELGVGCFKLISTGKPWEEARNWCQVQEDADLYTADRQYQLDFIWDTIGRVSKARNYHDDSVWSSIVGIRDGKWLGEEHSRNWTNINATWPVDQGCGYLLKPGMVYGKSCNKTGWGFCERRH